MYDSDSLSDSQWLQEANRQYAADRGSQRPDQAWILSPYDVWYANPYYTGPAVRHPEDNSEDEAPVRTLKDVNAELRMLRNRRR